MATQSPAERVTADEPARARSSPPSASAIADGEFAPNQRLVEADLSERFGASRGNVRAALLQLTSEGLVERDAVPLGPGAELVSLTEAIEITEVRMVLQ